MKGLRWKRLYGCQFTLSTQLIILNYPVTLYTVRAYNEVSYLHDWKIHHLTAVCSSLETKTGFSGNEACILTKGIKKHPPSYQCLSSGWQTEKENRKSKNTSCTWLDIVITSKTIHVATPTKEFSVGWGKVSAKPKLNPLHPWHHYVYSQYCSLHKSWGADRENLVKNQELLYSWWSSPLFSFKDQVLLEEKAKPMHLRKKDDWCYP